MQLSDHRGLEIQLQSLRDERDPLAALLRRVEVRPLNGDSDEGTDLTMHIEYGALVAGVTNNIGACVLKYNLDTGWLTAEQVAARTGERTQLTSDQFDHLSGLVILALAELRGVIVGGPVFM